LKTILIASTSKNLVIGNNQKLPWVSKPDLNHFKNTTINNTVLMGRKTFESIGSILPERLNIVLSRSKLQDNHSMDSLVYSSSIEEAKSIAHKSKNGDLYVIGGGEIFSQTIEQADEIIISHFQFYTEGDTYFPEINPTKWIETKRNPFDNFHISYYSKRN
jgi:dihydrofolate reductase